MSKERIDSNSVESASIPPPPDPFPTYQTPFPRSQSSSDEPNAFILFRRYADSQLSSFFSRLPSMIDSYLGIETPSDRKHSDRLEKKEAANIIESDWSPRSEGYWKQTEQAAEENRMRDLQRKNFVRQMLQETPGLPNLPEEAIHELALYDKFLGPLTASIFQEPMMDRPHMKLRKFASLRDAEISSPEANEPHVKSSKSASQRYPETFNPGAGEPQAFLWWTNSPYSPLRLRNQDDKSHPGEHMSKLLDWDTAFQELIKNGDDDSTATADPFKTHLLNSYDAARDFRGISGPAVGSSVDARKAAVAFMTDLDTAIANAWPAAWKNLNPRHRQPLVTDDAASQASTSHSDLSWSADQDGPRKGALYHTTTTNKRMLPNGSIETKEVRTIGYQDGREETTESVRVEPSSLPRPLSYIQNTKQEKQVPQSQSQSQSQPQPQPQPQPQSQTQHHVATEEVRQEARKFGKGWFWN